MSIYSVKGKGWRYEFTLKGVRHTEAWFKTKTEAKQAEAEKRREAKHPKPVQEVMTDITFLDLVNLRLDHVKAYNSERHYQDLVYRAKRWVKSWHKLLCDEISEMMYGTGKRNKSTSLGRCLPKGPIHYSIHAKKEGWPSNSEKGAND
jgi:hypothetical protein